MNAQDMMAAGQAEAGHEDAPASKQRRITNLGTRIITGLSLLPIVIFITLWGGVVFAVFIGIIIILAALEFDHMARFHLGQREMWWAVVPGVVLMLMAFYQHSATLLLAAVVVTALGGGIGGILRGDTLLQAGKRMLVSLGGLLYIGVPGGMILAIRNIVPFGNNWLYAVLFATWGADTFAYLAGRAFGRTPLAPRLSPNKTVEGAIGGIVGGIFFPSLVLLQIEALNPGTFLLLCIAPFFAIAGDLFESALKRRCQVKDSGIPGLNPFPGHGGVLDRIDALLFVTVIFYAYLTIQGLVAF